MTTQRLRRRRRAASWMPRVNRSRRESRETRANARTADAASRTVKMINPRNKIRKAIRPRMMRKTIQPTALRKQRHARSGRRLPATLVVKAKKIRLSSRRRRRRANRRDVGIELEPELAGRKMQVPKPSQSPTQSPGLRRRTDRSRKRSSRLQRR